MSNFLAKILLNRVADLSEEDRTALRTLSQIAYPPGEWADWPGRQVEWASPEWCVRILGEDGSLLSFVGVYVREAECDGQAVQVGGVGNVKTHPSVRGRGYAGLGIRRAMEFFSEQVGVGFALLVCEPHLIGYYARLGWQEFVGRLVVRQNSVATDFTLCRVMTCGVGATAPVGGTIDLCGPPW